MDHVADPVPPSKKPRPPPSTDILDYLKKLMSLTPRDLEERIGKGLLVTDQVEGDSRPTVRYG